MSTTPDSSGQASALLVKAAIGVSAALAVLGATYALSRNTSNRRKKRVLAIITAPYAPPRFPGKPLTLIAGKPLIQHVWERAKKADGVDRLVVAADQDSVAECCRSFGAEVVVSPPSENGTLQCVEVVKQAPNFDVIVILQADEPLIDPAAITGVTSALLADDAAASCLGAADLKAAAAADIHRVKCAADVRGYALYLSRALIPQNMAGCYREGGPYLLTLGIQAYRQECLQDYARHEAGVLEQEERVEALRVLEMGRKLKVLKVPHRGQPVDVAEDVKKIEDLLLKG